MYLGLGHYRYQRLKGRKSRTQETVVSLYEQFYHSLLTWTPALSLSEREDGELFYDMTFSQNWTYRSSQSDDFFRFASLDLRMSRSWRRDHFAYTGLGGGANIYLLPWERLGVGFNVQYDELFKESYGQGGGIYGGGRGASHSFYGLDYQDAFGHRIWTLKGRLNGELARIYSSWELLPVYFREVRLLAGVDYIDADFIWLARDQVLVRKPLTSHHWGVRLELDLFYRNPGFWDFLWINLHNPFGGEDQRRVFLSSFNFSF